MKVLITGGAGFLGQQLARALLDRGHLRLEGQPREVSELVLLDVAAAHDFGDPRVRALTGDIGDPAVLDAAIDTETQVIFHLAAIVSGQAEAEFDLGMRINLDASRTLFDICRRRGHVPHVLLTSSVAVLGGTLPAVIRDDTAVHPQTSYGTQKAIAELLLADHTRRGHLNGRGVRLPTITVRPGRPNAAASSFASGIIREPLNGERAVCPVKDDARMWVLSPDRAIESIIRCVELDRAALGDWPILNLPGLSVSIRDMVDALTEVCGADVAARIDWVPDARIERMVRSWPDQCDPTRGEQLGLKADRNFADVIRAYIASQHTAKVAG